MPTRQNFYLWGSWGARVAHQPFLTQKLDEPVQKVCIGPEFILALRDDGMVVSWGEDTQGLLGLSETSKTAEPKQLEFRVDTTLENTGAIIDILLADRHALALSEHGEVFSWGANDCGQLGHGNETEMKRPTFVAELGQQNIVQIAVLRKSSFALSDKGQVYGWGSNEHSELGLESSELRVNKPQLLTYLAKHKVLKLEVQHTGGEDGTHETLLAYVDTQHAAKLMYRSMGSTGIVHPTSAAEKLHIAAGERAVLSGISLMRQTLDHLRDWWAELLKLKHGSPYDIRDNLTNESPMDLDQSVDIQMLKRADEELETFIHTAKKQLVEVGSQSGQANAKFMIDLFVDSVMLRREKIARARSARTLTATLEEAQHEVKLLEPHPGDFERVRTTLRETLDRTRRSSPSDVIGLELQKALVLALETRLSLVETQIDLLKTKSGGVLSQMSTQSASEEVIPALRLLRERWNMMKHFSLYTLYQEMDSGNSREEDMMETLVKEADKRIDQCVSEKDKPNKELLIPSLCYDLLLENAQLRKLCNSYQLKVLVHHSKGPGGPTGAKK